MSERELQEFLERNSERMRALFPFDPVFQSITQQPAAQLHGTRIVPQLAALLAAQAGRHIPYDTPGYSLFVQQLVGQTSRLPYKPEYQLVAALPDGLRTSLPSIETIERELSTEAAP